jgi:hypothetical protein
MAKDFFPFSQKFFVENGILHEFRALVPRGIHRFVLNKPFLIAVKRIFGSLKDLIFTNHL